MADITMCTGEGCVAKQDCKRFTEEANPYRQSYFVEPPWKVTGPSTFSCVMFWGETQCGIMETLEEACSGKR